MWLQHAHEPLPQPPTQAPDANTQLHHYSLNAHRITSGDFFYWWALCTGNLSSQKTWEKNISSHLSTVPLKRNACFFPATAKLCTSLHIHLYWPKRDTAGIFYVFDTEAKKLSQITNECHLLLETKMPSICKPGPGFSETASLKKDASICTWAPVWLAESLSTVLNHSPSRPVYVKAFQCCYSSSCTWHWYTAFIFFGGGHKKCRSTMTLPYQWRSGIPTMHHKKIWQVSKIFSCY